MPFDTSLRTQSCQNASCRYFGQVLQGNIWSHSRKENRLKCKACCSTWAVSRNTPAYRLRTENETLVRAWDLLRSGTTIRDTARFLHVSISSVQRWKRRLFTAARRLECFSLR